MRLVSDFALAVICIWQEARGEPQAGRVAIGEVIRNRAKLANADVAEIVLAPYQFSGYNTKDPNRIPSFLLEDTDPIVKLCAEAWLQSAHTNLTEGATHYANLSIVTPPWIGGVTPTVMIGRHSFFREDRWGVKA